MDIKTIQQYVRTTTSNTNPAVLASMIRSTGQGSSKSGNIMYLEIIPDKVASIPELKDLISGGSGSGRSYFDALNASYEEVKNHVLAGGAIGLKSSIADMIEKSKSTLPREISGTVYSYSLTSESIILDFTATSTNDTSTLALNIGDALFAVPSDPSILIDRPPEG